jgi:hypothetical protein
VPSPNWLDGLQRNIRRLADIQQAVRSLGGELEQSTRLSSIVVLQRTQAAAPQSPRLELGRRGKLAEHFDFDGQLVKHLLPTYAARVDRLSRSLTPFPVPVSQAADLEERCFVPASYDRPHTILLKDTPVFKTSAA